MASSFTFEGLTSARILAVGGGGGGGGIYTNTKGGVSPYGGGGGGGAGGALEVTNLYSEATYSVNVGEGGEAGVGASNKAAGNFPGGNGGDTIITTNGVAMIEALGGGGGGGQCAGLDGASGGGGSYQPVTASSGEPRDGGKALNEGVQGHDGGRGSVAVYGAGGGGAGAAGKSSTEGGQGGDGLQSDIAVAVGTAKDDWPWYAGGGGGGNADKNVTGSTTGIAGGQGGGGQGGVGRSPAAGGEAQPGVDGTGGGGGGAGKNSTTAAGKGGCGVVIVRIEASLNGALKKPTDSQVRHDGGFHEVVQVSPFIKVVSGTNGGTEVGSYTLTVKPVNTTWTDGTEDEVTVTLVIYDESSLPETTVDVTGAPITFVGADAYSWIDNGDGTKDLLIKFLHAGAYKLPGSTSARILAVGGGGGGGGIYTNAKGGASPYGGGGGGGAGGMVEMTNLYSEATYSVKVGLGGKAGIGASNKAGGSFPGENGGDTTIITGGVSVVEAFGGGGGGGQCAGLNGASGGGGSYQPTSTSSGEPRDGGKALNEGAQGHDGGQGDVAVYGGGGGGAGAPGLPGGTAETHGMGGDGRQSSITNANNAVQSIWPWFAGGGGGGNADKNVTGSTTGIAGGQGGGGQGGVGRSPAAGGEAQPGVDGTGGGGGGAGKNSTTAAGRGGSGIVYVRISSAMKGEFKKPAPTSEHVYDREEHRAIEPSVFYTIGGDNVGTTVGVYTAWATLKTGGTWPDGTTDVATNVMTILPKPVTITGLHIDSWTFHDKTIPEPGCGVDPEWAPLNYEWRIANDESGWTDWSVSKPTHAGAYELRVRLQDEWNYALTAPVDPVEFTIRKVTVTYSNLKQLNWMAGTPPEDVPKPTCTVEPSWVAKVFEYEGTGEEGAWSTNLPVTVGIHRVRVMPPDLEDYELSPDSAEPVEFQIVKGLGNIFTDYVDIRIAPYTGTEPPPPLTNFPYRLEISELDPVGFLYSRVAENGEEMTFTDESGDNMLPYKVDIWTTNGVSIVYVRLPELADKEQTIRLYWHLRPGVEPPPHSPDLVWSDWKREDADKVAIPPRTFPDPVSSDGKYVAYWTQDPPAEMSRTFWDTKDPAYDPADPEHTKGEIIRDAESSVKDRIGTKRTILDTVTGKTYDKIADIPDDVGGAFRVTWELDDETGAFRPLEWHIDFAISSHTPESDLRGDAKSLTLSGRVMLANDDWFGADAPTDPNAVTDQSYWQTREVDIGGGKMLTNDVFWVHGGEEHGSPLEGLITHMLAGTEHRLKFMEEGVAKTLWRFGDVMIGNTFPNSRSLFNSQCALPRSTTQRGITSYANRDNTSDVLETGNLILRNKRSAVVYSPCYTNGIGTIYFDTVNAFVSNDKTYYHIVVEVATETEDGEIPTDENAAKDGATTIEEELGKIKAWKPLTILPLERKGAGTEFTPLTPTNEFTLSVTKDMTTDYFYRMCVRVDERRPCRFRIRRLDVNEKPGITADSSNLILIDNILVSYPGAGADMAPYGIYDETKVRKQVIGQENAFIPPFPSVKDTAVFGRGTPIIHPDYMTKADPGGFIPLSKLHYRWRYLDQASNAWETVDLSPGDDFVAQAAFSLTNREGDVEFWYENCINAPYYKYFDYSGLRNGSGDPLGLSGWYSEEHTTVTNGFENPWFVRLRPGKSDTEAFRLYVKTAADATPEIVDMSLVGNRLWRGFYQTIDPVDGGDGKGLFVRFEALNRQIAGSKSFASNVTYYALHGDVTDLEEPTSLEPMPSSNRWSRVVCDAKTGHLLFQLSETTFGATIVHADYQDFNRWNDANVISGGKPVFVGTSTDTNAFNMSGTSPVAREFTEKFDWWRYSLATNKYWSESFDDIDPAEAFKPFSEGETPNGFTVGAGQWVTAAYRDPASGMALQMKGKGEGYIQFVNAAEAPRGLESVVFNARIGQALEFGDFTYFADARITEMTDYTFFCRGTYDINQRRDFSGNATLSLVAFYNAGEGCYELRVEQENAVVQSGQVTGAGNDQRLTLYRWNYDDESGEILPTSLGSYVVKDNAKMLTTSSEKGNYGLLFISAKNTGTATEVCAGVSLDVGGISTVSGNVNCRWVSYIDDSANRLKNGFFGVLSANCPARFRKLGRGFTAQKPTTTSKHTFHTKDQNFSFPTQDNREFCRDSIDDGGWVIKKNRLETIDIKDPDNFGFQAKSVTQPLKVLVGPPGSTKASDYREILSTNLTDYSAIRQIELKLWTLDECSVKVMTGGTATSQRNDVVIDNFELRQWRGESYNGKEGQKYFDDFRDGSPSNFVFTQAWITDDLEGDKVCRLSAKRSSLDEPTSIRTPLMDGSGGRGKGLGMISFTYADAQTNVNLLVQVATNAVTRGLLANITASKADDGEWTTVTNFSFAGASAGELASGVRSVYFGLHDVVGAMRIVMDPEVVEAVTAVSNENLKAFGEIDITGVLCRDEPKLDESSWWGWNIRTSDEDSRRYLWDETPTGLGRGLSFALNNSVFDDVLERDKEFYPQHLPFLQTPTFDVDMIGEIAFQARKYAATDPDTRIVLFGTRFGGTSDDETGWTKVTEWTITDTIFTPCSYKTLPGDAYCAFRLAVTGVEGVQHRMPDPEAPEAPIRVLIDEVAVMDAVRARIAFRNTAAFRSHLDTNRAILDILSKAEQPLCREAFGVQTEIYPAQLAEEVDLSTARVRLWWYPDDDVWGWQNWTNRAGSGSAWLAACEGTNLVFRSSYPAARDAVIDPLEQAGVVQYALEVVYMTEGVEKHDWIEKTDWEKPTWYHPVDFNRDRAAEGFSPFTILDEVAPGYAWINEVNMYDGPDAYDDISWTNQYVEVAVPSEADIDSWKLQFITGALGDDTRCFTNEVVVFGSNVTSTKSVGGEANYVFITAGNPKSCSDATKRAGTIDGAWTVRGYSSEQSQLNEDGSINPGFPIGIQLVRPSGIIEHQIVIAGTNMYADIPAYAWQYSATNFLANLKRIDPESQWVFPGEDTGDNPHNSQSATNQFGREGMWLHEGKTPGRLNGGEWIDPDHPTPQGESIILYANLEGGHIWQASGRYESTTKNLVLYVPKGGAGTDIVYQVDHWYELGRVTENGKEVPGLAGRGADGSPVVFTAAVGASNNVTVVAGARIATDLREKYGLTDRNPYTPAVMAWLEGGATLRGEFANPDGEVKLADTHCFFSDNFITNMTLTEMYWLDMDPTVGGLVLKIGAQAKGQHEVPGEPGTTNVDIYAYMMISNKADAVTYTPYTLRGIEPGDLSHEYAGVWTAETFRVTGTLLGRSDIVDLKYWVFGPNSFHDDGSCHINLDYPYDPPSPGYYHGWGAHRGTTIGYWLRLDANVLPIAPRILTPAD